MKISYNWLQSFFKKKLPLPEKVADLLNMHSFETSLGKQVGPASPAKRGEQDYLLEIDVLPNRAHDCLSHLGIAREIATLLNYSFKPIDYSKKIKVLRGETIKKFLKMEVKDKTLCPRYTARALVEVKVKPSPQWIEERLKICGLRPISNVVDIANYVMLETGQPLHAFDADKLEAKTIIVRRAKKGEKIITLDDEAYDLNEDILVIADKKNPVCLAGIKGGKGSEIDSQTKRVILEAANFSPQIIRQGSLKLKLKTDASWRFGHELDPNLTEGAIDMAAYLIQEIAEGKVLDGVIDVYLNKIRPKKVNLDIERVKSLLGVDISPKEIESILERLGFEVKNLRGELSKGSLAPKFQVTIPTRRLDVSILEDLIEEIGRVYGYEKIPAKLPTATLIPPERNEDLVYQDKIRDALNNLGFSEVYNYSFISEKETANYKLQINQLVEVANPVSQEQKYLRPNLIFNLLKNVKENKKYFDEIRLFEIGQVFQKGPKDKAREKKKLAGIISLEGKSEGQGAQEFYQLKGVIDSVLNKLRIGDIWYDDEITKVGSPVPDFCHQSRRAEVKVGHDCLGWLGEVDTRVLEMVGIDSRVAGFELDFEKLITLATEERIYCPPSKYPAVVRDIALLVEIGTKVEEVLNLIHAAGGHLIKDIDLFDIYEGEEIPQGKKNLAFHIIYQADDRTLTDKEINQLQEKIIKALEEEGGWEVRR